VKRARRVRRGAAVALLVAVCGAAAAGAEPVGTELVPAGSTWRYLDDGSDPGPTWRDLAFDDGSWASGPAQLGYGDGDEATAVNGGPSGNRFITTWFRHSFPVSAPGSIEGLTLSLLRDDGAIAYLNGTEVVRENMPAGPVGPLTPASATVGGAEEDAFFDFAVPAGLLVTGDNVLAVEIHQSGPTSSDISFDLALTVSGPPSLLERPPYLQNGTPGSVVVRWRTTVATDTVLLWGDAPGNLVHSIAMPAPTTEHEVEISGLAPETRAYYAVGDSTGAFAGDDADHFFTTLPLPGSRRPVRIWAVGDSGECAASQQGCIDAGDVRDAYLSFAGSDLADVWLMLGDNAYSTGTDQQYTDGLFAVYSQVLRNTILWPVPGNHEFGASDSPSQTGPYYQAFTLPTGSGAAGFPSGTEAYYSFDYGNVHFVALDSHDTDRSAPASPETNVCAPGQGGAMYQWLCADLASTSADFIIAYWHHPPYTKGSHDSDDASDSGGRMRDMRERFLPVLEAYGVDLQLTGHSHAYERSVLLDGHYGVSSSYDPLLHAVDPGDGDPAGDGAYLKSAVGPVAHEGTVYSVVGSSSKTSGGPLNHPVMTVSLNALGSMIVDVVGRQLDARFLDDGGSVRDHFRLVKGPPLPECANGLDDDGDGAIDFPADLGCRDAGWIEEPQCQDGLDNDGDGRIDFDGGASRNGGVPLADADPQCVNPYNAKERRPICGLGAELALALAVWGPVRRRRRAAAGRREAARA
jgi:Calcineurin-like phosphoesterase